MANERTFLAWIRTSIGIMAFGFVVERFALFIKQLTFFLGKTEVPVHLQTGHSYSLIFGILLVGIGVLISVLAFVRYKKIQRQIEEDVYSPSSGLDLIFSRVSYSQPMTGSPASKANGDLSDEIADRGELRKERSELFVIMFKRFYIYYMLQDDL
jgi:putative membrane protein